VTTTTIAQLPELKRRRQARALQSAQLGIYADPSITTELERLNVVIQQMELIDIHRANLSHQLRQIAHFGANAPTYIVNSIRSERQDIARLKAICAQYGQPIESHPLDEESTEAEPGNPEPGALPRDPLVLIRERLRDVETLLRHNRPQEALEEIVALRKELGA